MKPATVLLLALLASAGSLPAASGIRVDCTGSGDTVFLVGGGPAFTTWNLVPIQQHLGSNYRVCRCDMRGVGDNAALPLRAGKPALEQWIEDMATVLPPQPVVLWGHSWGALQALLFAKRHPDRVRALVLNNPVDPALKSLENIEFKRFVHPFVESHLKIEHIDTPAERRHRFRSKIASYFLDARTGWEYSAQFSEMDANNPLNVQIWQEYRRNPLTVDDIEALSPKIARLIYCRTDVLMPESQREYARAVPAERHEVLDNCAHFPWVESPREFYRALDAAMRDAHE